MADRSGDAVPVLAWMLEHREAARAESLSIALSKLLPSARVVPVASLSRTLLNGNADQRRAAAIVLLEARSLITEPERDAVEAVLISALADPSIEVRKWVAMSLRRLGSVRATAALAESLKGTDVSSAYYGQATGRARPPPARPPPPAFSDNAVRRLEAVAPGFLAVLQSGDGSALRGLIEALAKTPTADSAAVLHVLLFPRRRRHTWPTRGDAVVGKPQADRDSCDR